jgi:hypothetical protein
MRKLAVDGLGLDCFVMMAFGCEWMDAGLVWIHKRRRLKCLCNDVQGGKIVIPRSQGVYETTLMERISIKALRNRCKVWWIMLRRRRWRGWRCGGEGEWWWLVRKEDEILPAAMKGEYCKGRKRRKRKWFVRFVSEEVHVKKRLFEYTVYVGLGFLSNGWSWLDDEFVWGSNLMDSGFWYFARIMEDELNEWDDSVFWHIQVC